MDYSECPACGSQAVVVRGKDSAVEDALPGVDCADCCATLNVYQETTYIGDVR